MEIYLLKSAACLSIFFVFYKLFMEKESFHLIKRFYLLFGIAASFCIPFITFTTYIEAIPVTNTVTLVEGSVITSASETEEAIKYLPIILWSVYLLGVLFFTLKFFRNLFSLVQKIQKNPTIKSKNVFHVLLKLPVTPHTFFNYIFLHKEKFQKGEIPKEVLIHEQAHAEQKHSLDILLMELLQIVFWFNPLLYFYKHSIKLNHEFLADQAVLYRGNKTADYQKILLAFSSNAASPAMAHSINYSSFKKRFTVMKTHTSKRTAWLKTGLLLPLVALLLYGFSTTQIVEKPSAIPENIESLIERDMPTTNIQSTIIQKSLVIMVSISEISINGKKSSLKTFANDLDAATKGWEETDYTSIKPQVYIASTPQEFLDKLETEFKKTYLYKANQGMRLVPPPPPPPPTPSTSGEVLPPPPPPPSPDLGTEVMRTYKNSIILYVNGEDIYLNGKKTPISNFTNALNERTKDWKKEDFKLYGLAIEKVNVSEEFIDKINAEYRKSDLAKRSQSKEKYLIGTTTLLTPPPPPPPPPPSPEKPLDHLIAMAKKGAHFFYENEAVTSDKAIELLKENPELNIQTRLQDPKPPKVYISKKGIIIKEKGMGAVLPVEKINGLPQPVSRSQYINNLKVMNRHGAKFYLNGAIISYNEAVRVTKKYLREGVNIKLNSTFDPDDVNIITYKTVALP
ncbi:M56 family metallopeptidase [Jejudonia soesokkakensis]|uniref:M56 family metallopeptidase n=1 Tax=Jejudonia soesokkakensis TaxID=1323432 RepID=A0ABW2MRL9_9FLAO